jgi:hypothetical protein
MRLIAAVLIATASLSIAGCSAGAMQAWGAGLQAAADGYAAGAGGTAMASGKLMIFGGPGHKTYLGCLNCSEYASDSVFNKYGTHGSAYSAESIFNGYSTFGSAYGPYSPCNPYATDPPVLVDANGGFHGRLTVNAYNIDRSRSSRVQAWITGVCGG